MQIFSSARKTSSRRSSPSPARRAAILVIVALCSFGLLAYARGGVGTAAATLFSPIASGKRWLWESTGTIPSYFQTKHALESEIGSLRERLQAGERDAFRLKELEAENESLRAELGFKKESRIVAAVLAQPNQTPYDTLLIARGADDDVAEGAFVYLEGDIAIGEIIQVYADSALVRLVTSPGVRTSAYVFGPDLFVEAEGMGGGVLRIGMPQGVPLAVGNVVVLPGASAGAYGEIVRVESEPSNPDQYGYVTTPVPLSSMRYVSVARTPAPTISYEQALGVIRSAKNAIFHVDVPSSTPTGVTAGAATSTPHATTTEQY
jgi:cell shape-determining protein MreC